MPTPSILEVAGRVGREECSHVRDLLEREDVGGADG